MLQVGAPMDRPGTGVPCLCCQPRLFTSRQPHARMPAPTPSLPAAHAPVVSLGRPRQHQRHCMVVSTPQHVSRARRRGACNACPALDARHGASQSPGWHGAHRGGHAGGAGQRDLRRLPAEHGEAGPQPRPLTAAEASRRPCAIIAVLGACSPGRPSGACRAGRTAAARSRPRRQSSPGGRTAASRAGQGRAGQGRAGQGRAWVHRLVGNAAAIQAGKAELHGTSSAQPARHPPEPGGPSRRAGRQARAARRPLPPSQPSCPARCRPWHRSPRGLRGGSRVLMESH